MREPFMNNVKTAAMPDKSVSPYPNMPDRKINMKM